MAGALSAAGARTETSGRPAMSSSPAGAPVRAAARLWTLFIQIAMAFY